MAFAKDPQAEAYWHPAFGEYETTFTSASGQVKADLLRRGQMLEAHVYYPTGLDGLTVTDRWITPLYEYARDNGYGEERLRIWRPDGGPAPRG